MEAAPYYADEDRRVPSTTRGGFDEVFDRRHRGGLAQVRAAASTTAAASPQAAGAATATAITRHPAASRRAGPPPHRARPPAARPQLVRRRAERLLAAAEDDADAEGGGERRLGSPAALRGLLNEGHFKCADKRYGCGDPACDKGLLRRTKNGWAGELAECVVGVASSRRTSPNGQCTECGGPSARMPACLCLAPKPARWRAARLPTSGLEAAKLGLLRARAPWLGLREGKRCEAEGCKTQAGFGLPEDGEVRWCETDGHGPEGKEDLHGLHGGAPPPCAPARRLACTHTRGGARRHRRACTRAAAPRKAPLATRRA